MSSAACAVVHEVSAITMSAIQRMTRMVEDKYSGTSARPALRGRGGRCSIVGIRASPFCVNLAVDWMHVETMYGVRARGLYGARLQVRIQRTRCCMRQQEIT